MQVKQQKVYFLCYFIYFLKEVICMQAIVLKVPRVPCGIGDHDRRSVGHLWAFCGFSVSNICASIIMMQKVAANVDNVAADLCFRASEVRWLLMKIFFCYCRYFCRYFFPLYIIGC